MTGSGSARESSALQPSEDGRQRPGCSRPRGARKRCVPQELASATRGAGEAGACRRRSSGQTTGALQASGRRAASRVGSTVPSTENTRGRAARSFPTKQSRRPLSACVAHWNPRTFTPRRTRAEKASLAHHGRQALTAFAGERPPAASRWARGYSATGAPPDGLLRRQRRSWTSSRATGVPARRGRALSIRPLAASQNLDSAPKQLGRLSGHDAVHMSLTPSRPRLPQALRR